MLNGVKVHENIPTFLGYSDNPHGLMMEYVGFDFSPFDTEKVVCNLEDFYHYVDCEFDFEAFADILPVCIKDTVAGLEYLHQHNIAHRDLTPSNVLVSNQHYCSKEQSIVAEMYAKCPIVAKVADFGLSRSLDAQTQSVLCSRTDDICRGTLIYMAPEIHTCRLTSASQDDLKKADIWSLGILAYAIINPNLNSPYHKESESLGAAFNLDIMKHFMQSQILPTHDAKYEVLRVTEWWQVDEIFNLCASFEPNSRPAATDILHMIKNGSIESSLVFKKLRLSQNTALEAFDLEFVREITREERLIKDDKKQIPENGATNACAFLAVAIGDAFLKAVMKNHDFSLEHLVDYAEEAINRVPSKINHVRDLNKMYEPSEAKSILEANNLLSANYDLIEECVSANGVFSEAGRKELITALTNPQREAKNRVGLYTCSPYTFLAGMHNNSYFVLDTHPIGEDLGGDGNGIVVTTKDLTQRSGMVLVQWILNRLQNGGLNGKEPQSFAWLMPQQETREGMLAFNPFIDSCNYCQD
ncbi:probable tyrosine-protein kinase DDB_G0283397 [Dendronephthya gigantea]|uniref:probable tyrosine-protein kinase DDB_G0283397 n=1 Tax=Dendronephthya gigantea TaxID=151771 RepID=UPI00106D23EB|nr:probable tyrosine-protein kinase DDB_G0283397 [Dendronephthya gigantea]